MAEVKQTIDLGSYLKIIYSDGKAEILPKSKTSFDTSISPGLKAVLDKIPVPAENNTDEILLLKFYEPIEANQYLNKINHVFFSKSIAALTPDAFGRYKPGPSEAEKVDHSANFSAYQISRLGPKQKALLNQIFLNRRNARNSGPGSFLENPLGNIKAFVNIPLIKAINPVASIATTAAIDHPVEAGLALMTAGIASAAYGAGAATQAVALPNATAAGSSIGGLSLPSLSIPSLNASAITTALGNAAKTEIEKQLNKQKSQSKETPLPLASKDQQENNPVLPIAAGLGLLAVLFLI